jgi:fructuronate reductase
MNQLNSVTLSELKAGVKAPSYAQGTISSGIVHFGIGNFHRAHQAVYCDALLDKGETQWGITGISMRSPNMRDKLAPQHFLYTQATLTEAKGNESPEYRIIGAIQNILVAPENPLSVIDAVAHNNTQLVTTTITEKGYFLFNGKINRDDTAIQHDLNSLDAPKTAYGFLAAAIIKRSVKQGKRITILCCDNMHAGGEHLRQGVRMLLEQHRPKTLDWLVKNVAFSSSMVDRVTPATNQKLIQDVANKIGLRDAAPVAAEPFTQWVIEDNFAGQRPPFDRVGAIFVDDIAPFEHIKLRFLNAGHSMLAAMGYLAGDTYIHEALQRPTLASFTEQALKNNVLPVTSAPDNINVKHYIDQVLERFRNGSLPYAVLQVCSDSSQKIQQRWLPSIDDALAQQKDFTYLAFALAAWVCFIDKALFNGDLNDPLLADFTRCQSSDSATHVQSFLNLAGAERFAFFSNASFMKMVDDFHEIITEESIEQAIKISKILET